MILITGATGHLGTATLQYLLKKRPASELAALVRDESKAAGLAAQGISVRVGNYDDMASLMAAMEGVKTVLLIAGTDEEKRVAQHQNVVNAAKTAGVKRIAYTSRTQKNRSTMANKLMEGHFDTEELIKASGMPYTIFRNVLYLDTLPQFLGPSVFDKGIYLPAGQGRVAFALRHQMGEAIANALASEAGGNQLYHLTGTEAYSFQDVAQALSRLTGKEIPYTAAEKGAFEASLKARNLPEVVIGRITGFMTDIANGQEDETHPDLERLLGRTPTSFEEGLKDVFKI